MGDYYAKDSAEPSPGAPYYYQEPPPSRRAPVQAMPPPAPPANSSEGAITVGHWDAELCGCCTHAVPNCLMATCCPCVSLAQISARLGMLSFPVALCLFGVVILAEWVAVGLVGYRANYVNQDSNYSNYDCYYYYICDYSTYSFGTAYTIFCIYLSLATIGIFLFVWHLRTQTRTRFQLPGTCCCDFWSALCCTCCSIAQVATHVKSYTSGNCNFGPPDTLPAYAPNGQTPSVGQSCPQPSAPSNDGSHYAVDIHQRRYNTPSTAASTAPSTATVSRPSTNSRSVPTGKSTSSNSNSLWEDPVIIAARIPYDGIQLQQCVSRGGNGEVYRAIYRNEYVAVKMLLAATRKDLTQINAFLSEIKLAATLEHPNIVQFIGVSWESLSSLYAVFEFMEGGDLRSLLTQYKLQNQPNGLDATKLRIAMEVAHALTYMHSLSPMVLHRDLKSRNILLSGRLEAKLTDFGASKIRLDRTLTAGVGTSLWMAPEVVMGERYDEKADVFSFGAVLSELDTHELPYEKARHNREDDQPLPDLAVMQLVLLGKLRMEFTASLAPEVRALAESCVNVDPKQRPTAAEVAYGLSKALKATSYHVI
jgi:Cys-rich protein (TIGR01571 family)